MDENTAKYQILLNVVKTGNTSNEWQAVYHKKKNSNLAEHLFGSPCSRRKSYAKKSAKLYLNLL